MGQDKALLPFGDEVLLQRTVRLLSEVMPQENIVVVAAADQTLPSLPQAIKVIRDEAPGLGPLPAIAAGLQTLSGSVEAAFVAGCDAPVLKPAAVAWLFEQLGSLAKDRYDGVALQDEDRLHPLFAVYRTSAAGGFAKASKSGEASLHGALRSAWLKMQFIDVDQLRGADPRLDSLVNCNTLVEYQAAVERAGLGTRRRNGAG
jgi:molybdopterin-guanine dinucleotide biosynthesis protein A